MSRPLPAASLPQEEQIEKFLAGNFGGSTIDQMFSKDEIVKLKLLMVKRADNNFQGDLPKALLSISKSLENLGRYNTELRNVDEQAYKIKEAELKPGKINVSEMAASINSQVPFQGQDPKGGYFSRRGNIAGVASSVWGGSKEARRAVRENKLSGSLIDIPSTYRNLVMDARSECREDVAIAEANLFAELNGDPQLTKKEEKKIRKTNHRVASNVSEFAAFGALKGFNWMTRGILSHSKAGEDARVLDYQKDRLELIAGARALLDPGSRGKTAHLHALRKFYEGLASSPQTLDPAEFSELQSLITNAILAEGKATKDEVEAFNTKINELNDEILKKTKDLLKDEDDAWKYRIAQIVLIMSPFGFFNYMMPVANILGPLFSSSLTFGEGIGKMMTEIPVFGDIVAAVKLDVAVAAIVDNCPIVSEFGQVVDSITDSEAAQNLFGAVSPIVTGSPLIPIAIAIASSGSQAEKSYDRKEKSDTVFEEGKKKLAAEFDKLRQNIEGNPHKKRIAELAAKEIDANANRIFLRSLVDFISNSEEEELAIFNSVKFDGKTLLDLKKEKGQSFSSTKDIMSLLLAAGATQDMRGKLIKSFFAYDKICEDSATKRSLSNESEEEIMAHNLGNFERLNVAAMNKLAEDEYVRRRQEFVIDLAENAGLPKSIYQGDDPESRKRMAAEYEARIIQNKVNRRDNVLAFTPAKEKPATSPVPPLVATPGIAPQFLSKL